MANDRAAGPNANPVWILLYLPLGAVGSLALIIPAAGFLAYIAALAFPLIVVAEVAGAVFAALAGGRWGWIYLLGNLGALAASVVTMIISWVGMVITDMTWQPDPAMWAPIYFGVVVMGLSGGITLGALKRS